MWLYRNAQHSWKSSLDNHSVMKTSDTNDLAITQYVTVILILAFTVKIRPEMRSRQTTLPWREFTHNTQTYSKVNKSTYKVATTFSASPQNYFSYSLHELRGI